MITLQSHGGVQRQHDVSGCSYFLLERGQRNDTEGDAAAGGETSRWHAALLRNEQGDCFIMDLSSTVDLDSTTGTFMNGMRLKPNRPHRWTPNTTVVLGRPPFHDKAVLHVSKGIKRPCETSVEVAAAAACAGPKRRQCAPGQEDHDLGTQGGGGSSGSTSVRGGTPKPRDAATIAGEDKNPSASVKCDKCDGPHRTEACPHFRKPREGHKDAWVNYGRKHPAQMGRSGGKYILTGGKAVPQPGDGSCLFHSLCFGLNGGARSGRFMACRLRKELAQFVQQNPRVEISGDTIEEWVKWDANTSVASYCRRIASGGWGGGIEMAACSLMKRVNVHVYERRRAGGFERIACFDSPTKTDRTIHVLYQGGVHYDALLPR